MYAYTRYLSRSGLKPSANCVSKYNITIFVFTYDNVTCLLHVDDSVVMFTASAFKNPFRYLDGQEGRHDVEDYFVDMATPGDSDIFRVSNRYTITLIGTVSIFG